MGLVAALVLGALVIYLIAYPILTDDQIDDINYKQRIKSFEQAGELVERDTILAELSELEMDYHLAQLNEKEYQDFKERLREILSDKEK